LHISIDNWPDHVESLSLQLLPPAHQSGRTGDQANDAPTPGPQPSEDIDPAGVW